MKEERPSHIHLIEVQTQLDVHIWSKQGALWIQISTHYSLWQIRPPLLRFVSDVKEPTYVFGLQSFRASSKEVTAHIHQSRICLVFMISTSPYMVCEMSANRAVRSTIAHIF